ncbi:phage/plasmid primase, P4 family [Galactobacillus timonensis]|uniref:phage/plasmid primase, P4 family n=1 Tax=Galactobacillus timonensis TaxID=2041840 RepID=UPI001AEC518B|nr:phage/plasmid primase, P4 family [Galactobacillus timonensis]
MMKFTLYTADCTGNEANCLYPHKVIINSPEEFASAVARDHVTAAYKGNYRSNDNFLSADAIVWDCDNDFSENPDDWVTPEKLAKGALADVSFAASPSRHNMLRKENFSPRPRFHLIAPITICSDSAAFASLKKAGMQQFPFFDSKALDAARFLYGTKVNPEDVFWHEGALTIDEILPEKPDAEEVEEPLYTGGSIPEGSRNNTMSHFAGRVLKRFGPTEKAYEAYLERAGKCDPPLLAKELRTIWHSALKFYKNKVERSEGYVPPDEYEDTFGTCFLKPEDYSDIGEAKVLAKECMNQLRFTSATDFIAFGGDRWYEDKQKSLGIVENFMDDQLLDATEAIRIAEENLTALGIPEEEVKARSKNLAASVPDNKVGLFYALVGADTYKKFVMKYRNYKNIVNTQNAAKPMMALDVSELDYDPELLNTPDATYDLTKGISGCHSHDPDDLITKITACSPGEKGKELWIQNLNLFFCGDQELIAYVQAIVGMAAVGRVYAEQMIIAYGGGANGKSTFWNTIARVLGNYSGKISAEALTMNCKRNVKPEMAELKGKRLIIASELEEGQRLNTGMVKQLCSVDPIEAEKKYKDPFHFDPSHTLVLYTNYLPKVSANDDGTWRRLIVIPFNAKITGTSDIKNYSDYLFEHAGPAILSWIIEGAKIAIQKGFKIEEPKAVRDAVDKYREDNDWLGQFIDEYCDVDPSYSEKSGDLYQQYHAICFQSGEYARSTTDFYGNLEKAGYRRKKTKSGILIYGLRLKSGQDFLN